jgi:hypothetical protein
MNFYPRNGKNIKQEQITNSPTINKIKISQKSFQGLLGRRDTILQPSFEEYNKLKKDSRTSCQWSGRHPDERGNIGICFNPALILLEA